MPIVVSDSKAEETLQAYAHPLSIQSKAISDLENRLLNGDIVADGNNVYTFLTEFMSNMTAGLVQKACACFNSLYPENAQTATDLYKHLSDFDYIGLFATPAEMTVELVFDRNFLIDNAVYDSTIKCFKIIVPEYSKFTVGAYTFGLMYPIEIRVRKAPNLPNGQTDYDNSVITVMWDTTNQNPLKTLESHILEHREFVQENQTLTAIEVPIYQFEVENHVENAIASTGFSKRYDYLNKFYAIRVFHFKGGQWNEMAQTLSDINYDVDKPTAMVKVLADIGKVEVVIPQIYFDTTKESASIGNRILVKIYNTQGELNLDLSGYNINQYQASFLLTDTILVEDDTYSNMLKRIPTIYMLPATTRISSGTDGITMDELKERVKHNSSYTVKITPDDLDAYFKTSGFTFTKELDNITDRVYCAHKVITDGTGTTIAAGEEKTYLKPENINIQENSSTGELYVPNYSSISVCDTNSFTVCPGAIYKYNKDKNYFEMLSDEDITVLSNKTIAEKIEELNSELYTYNPFHIRVSLDPSLPIASSYDMTDPTLKSIVFKWENPNTTAEISVYTADVKMLNTSSDGYRLSVALFRTANIADVVAKEQNAVNENNIHVMLSTTNSEGVYLYMLGEYDGKDATGHDVFIFDIKSKFKLTGTGMFDVLNMYDDTGDDTHNFLDADTHAYQLSFFIKEDFIPDSAYPMDGVPLTGIPRSLDGYVYLCQQEFKMKFGAPLPLIKNNLAIGVSSLSYQTYPTTQFATYNTPIYDRWTVSEIKSKAYDPVAADYVSSTKIGMLKTDVDATYYVTEDETFVEDKQYFTKDDNDVYWIAKVTPGAPVPSTTTYYNRIVNKYSPVIKHDQGDVIISSPYGFNYGPVTTLTINEDVNSMQLQVPYTVTSSANNIWFSIAGDLFVTGSTVGTYNGLYTETTGELDIKKRRWKHTAYAPVEAYDTTTIEESLQGRLHRVYLYKTVVDGVVQYSTTNVEGSTRVMFDISGTYYSSNHEKVATDPYVTSGRNTTVNTKARGLNRKWYLLIDNPSKYQKSFDFEINEGFMVEYNAVSLVNEGVEKSWNLSFYYRTKDASGLPCTGVCTIRPHMENCVWFSENDRQKFENDSYVAQYDDIVHVIQWVETGDSTGEASFTGWKMGITNDPTGNERVDYRYKAAVTDVYTLTTGTYRENIIYYKKVNGNFEVMVAGTDYVIGDEIPTGVYIRKVLLPHEAEWVNMFSSDKSALNVTCINNSSDNYKLRVEEALKYIINYVKDNGQTSTSSKLLNRYADKAKLTTDDKFQDDVKYYTRYKTTNEIWPYEYKLEDVTAHLYEPIPPNTYYNMCDPFLVDPLDGIVFTCVETCGTDTYALTSDKKFANGTVYFTRTGAGVVSDPYVYTQQVFTAAGTPLARNVYYVKNATTGVYTLTTDTKVVAGKLYYTRSGKGTEKSPYVYTLAIATYGAEVPANTFYNKTSCADGKKQEECNAEINYRAGEKDKTYIDREREVGTAGALGALYYKDTDYVEFDYAKYSLSVETIIGVMESWDKYKAYSEDFRYECVVGETGIALSLVKQLVSVSQPCFTNPWRKLVTLSSFNALEHYYDTRKIVNCPVAQLATIQEEIKSGYNSFDNLLRLKHALEEGEQELSAIVYVSDITTIDEMEGSDYSEAAKELREWLNIKDDESVADFANRAILGTTISPLGAFVTWDDWDIDEVIRCGYDEDSCTKNILSYSVYSGYMYICGKKKFDESAYKDAFINYTSKIDRVYQGESSTYTRNEFNINFETTIWSEIDKWPWEVTTPWLTVNKAFDTEIVPAVFTYNTDMSCAKALHLNTDVVLDEDGNPVMMVDGSRSETFMLDMLHCDYKLMLSNDADYVNYITDIRELLRSYFNEINTISPSLLARTKLYFAPIRTFGASQFKANGGTEVTLPLEFSIGLGLHVESYVNGSDLNKEAIKKSILSLIDARLKEGYLNLALLARDIMNDLNDNIICVDVLGINGDNGLQTMIPVKEDCFPQLKQVLELNDDGSVHTTRRLDITWYVID